MLQMLHDVTVKTESCVTHIKRAISNRYKRKNSNVTDVTVNIINIRIKNNIIYF